MKRTLLIIFIVLSLLAAFKIGELSPQIKNWQIFGNKQNQIAAKKPEQNIFDEINPSDGFEINASFGALGPKMIESGVIDFEKFKEAYERSGTKLSPLQIEILTKGSNSKIKIDRLNSYFLLNFFWAVGLNNNSRILSEGDMVKYGDGNQAGRFASTGGWILSKNVAMDYYSNNNLIPLSESQQQLVEKVASQIYRPCCDNSTAFPDCNHGMAMLGILELMAQNNATEKQMFEAAKYINAFWFPGNYYDLAIYFKNITGESFKDIQGEKILSKEYSSLSGYQTVKAWLAEKGFIKEPPKQGVSCGV